MSIFSFRFWVIVFVIANYSSVTSYAAEKGVVLPKSSEALSFLGQFLANAHKFITVFLG